MGSKQAKIPNSLRFYRRRNGRTQKDIAYLLGYQSTTAVSSYESGAKAPHLINLLKLEIIHRTPVAFLYWDHYETLRQEIRGREEGLRRPERRESAE